MSTLLLTGVRPLGGPARDLLVADGRITRVGERLAAPEGATVVDGRGQLAVPGLVDAHAHLDKTLWGLPWRPHTAGDGLAALIDNEHRGRAELRRQGVTVAQRAARLLGAYVAAGTSHIRSHVDVDTVAGLDSLHGVMEARDAFADRVDVELVAFPQSGLLVRPGTAELLEAAVRAGADLVGGLDPAGFDHRPVEHLDAVFAIAGRHGCGVDIHLHDGGELGAFTIDLIVERTRALGLAGKVTISHAFALAEVPEPRLGRLVEGLAGQRISLTTVAPGNRPPLPLARLRAAGVTVGLGCDGVRDLWSPWGDGDLLGGPPCSPGGPGPAATRTWPPPSSWPPPAGPASSGSTATAWSPAAGPTSPWSRRPRSARRSSPTRPAPWCSSAAGWSPGPEPRCAGRHTGR